MTTARGGGRRLLTAAAVAVALAAADTYVVVLALPDMVSGVGGDVTALQRAAPIVSGFLLGYVAVLPLIGRIADLRGRRPVLLACLLLFAAGSAVTALAPDLATLVAGRFLQGVGGGGLVPATLALVADLYPPQRRGVPLGVVSAVQEVGSVAGPLLGAVVLTVAGWRAIFWLNLGAALALALAVRPDAAAPLDGTAALGGPASDRLRVVGGWVLLGTGALAAALVLSPPPGLRADLRWGALYVPFAGLPGRWPTPLGALAVAAGVAFVAWCLRWRRPVDLPGWWAAARAADLPGSALLAIALGGVVLTFATADPKIELVAPRGTLYLAAAAAATVAFVLHLRRAADPVLPRGLLRHPGAWGSALASLLVGAALVAALVDVPLFARTTVYPDSPVAGSLVLVRLLVAVPVGALLGGKLVGRLPDGVIAAVGMACAALGFVAMTRWDATSLLTVAATATLLLTGLGFGLAITPLSAAMLTATADDSHAVASAVLVVARMIGMLVGISALTALGLRRFYTAQAGLPAVQEVCNGASRCPEFEALLRTAAITQEHTVFAGAAVCAVAAAVVCLATLVRTRRAGW